MRFALIGLGTAATRGHLPAMERLASEGRARLVAIAERNPSRRAEAERFAVPVFAQPAAMLEAVTCDAVIVAAEPAAHAELIVLALERGLHVVVEKPLTLTAPGYHAVGRAHTRRPDLAIVSVHQYRYAWPWRAIAWCARAAARLRLGYSVVVDVERPGPDPLARSDWRSDKDASGGVLADHGIHFLALAWTIDERLDVLAASRSTDDGVERAGASIRLRSGTLTLRLASGTDARRTCVAFEVAAGSLMWRGGVFSIRVGRRTLARAPASSLAERRTVDALYEPFYRDVTENLRRSTWRARRTTESLVVAQALLTLLDAAAPPEFAALVPADRRL